MRCYVTFWKCDLSVKPKERGDVNLIRKGPVKQELGSILHCTVFKQTAAHKPACSLADRKAAETFSQLSFVHAQAPAVRNAAAAMRMSYLEKVRRLLFAYGLYERADRASAISFTLSSSVDISWTA